MAYQGISTGTAPNDGLGDSLASGAIKINSNFQELYTALGDGTNLAVTEVVQDAVGSAINAGIQTGIQVTYDDANNRINFNLSSEAVQDIIGDAISVGIQTGISVTYDDTNNRINFSINGVIKSRQGPFTNTGAGTYAISPVTTSKSIINVIGAGVGIAAAVQPYSIQFLNATQVQISQGGTGSVSLTWEVIEFY